MRKILILSAILLITINAHSAKLTSRDADAAPDGADLLHTVDDVAGTPTSKKATIANVLSDTNIPNDLTIQSTKALTAPTVDTGQGANELYDMDQNVLQASSPTFADITIDGTIEGAALTEGGEAVYNSTETPGGELGGSWASPTIDDSVAVTGWDLTTPTLTTSLTTDSKTISEAEIGRLDALTGVIVTDATAVTDLEGTGLSIGAGVLNWAAASTDLSDTADLLYETELSNITELQAQIEDVSLILNNATSFGGDVSGTYDALVLGSDVANGTNIADNSIDSEHYVDGSIDIEHFGADTRRIGFVVINLENTTDFAFYKTPETITIANVSFVNTLGNVTGTLSECDSNGTSCVDVDADWTIGNTSNFTDSSFTNDEIDAGDWLRWNTTSTEENTTILTGTIRF